MACYVSTTVLANIFFYQSLPLPALASHPSPGFKSPARHALPFPLQKCTSPRHLDQLVAHLIHRNLLSDSSLISSVAFSGNLSLSRRLLLRSPNPTALSFNTLIRLHSSRRLHLHSLSLFRHMLRRGLSPDNFTLPFALKSASAFAADALPPLHSLLSKLGYASNVFVSNVLVHCYASSGCVSAARRAFDEIPERTVVSWNSMINAYSQTGCYAEAFSLFREMRWATMPDGFTLASVLSACSNAGNLDGGRRMHSYVVTSGAGVDLVVGNALVDMYGKCGELGSARRCFDRMLVRNAVTWTSLVCGFAKHGCVDLARDWFDRMPEKTTVSWNAIIGCYVRCGLCREALDLYTQMQNSGVAPDDATLVSVLSACSQNGNLVVGRKIHDYVRESITNPNVTLLNSILDLYAKSGYMDIALAIFDTMGRKSTVSWNVVIGAMAMHGRGSDAVELFRRMIQEGFDPDGITFVGLLSACGHGGLLEPGRYYFEAMTSRYKVDQEIEHYACMVDLLGRGGLLGEAVELISCMPMKPDIVIWGALLGACRIYGNMGIGRQVMKQMLELELYSGGLYVLISNMFCEAQRWEDAKKLRKVMKEMGIKKGKAASLIEINGYVYEFLVEDTRHGISSDIYSLLDRLTYHLMCVECISNPYGEFWDVQE